MILNLPHTTLDCYRSEVRTDMKINSYYPGRAGRRNCPALLDRAEHSFLMAHRSRS